MSCQGDVGWSRLRIELFESANVAEDRKMEKLTVCMQTWVIFFFAVVSVAEKLFCR